MKRHILALIAVLSVFLAFLGTGAMGNNNDIVIGKSISYYSTVLNEERTIFIACPENYNENENRYTVLYTMDGERYFRYTVALVQFLAQTGRIPQMIVVGIPNTVRSRDFSYKRTADKPLMGADYFIRFLKEELIPFVDQNYRTTSYRIIKGWCATGIFCIYILFDQPDLFNAYIASSPYLVEDAGFIFQLVEDFPKNGLKSREFLFMAVAEQDRPDAKAEIPKFAALLEEKEINGLEWQLMNLDKEDHYTIDLRTFYFGLETLYSELIYPRKLVEGGIESARNKIKALSAKYGLEGYFPEDMLTEMGYHLLNQECFQDAVTIFKIQVETYPNSWNAYDNLGEAYMMNGDHKHAIQYYQKSLKMNPENINAVKMLEKLEIESK